MNFSDIIGQDIQVNFLKNVNLNQFHHSWIFFGKKGVGKYSTLITFIKNNTTSASVLNNVHELKCDDKTSIDDLRDFKKFCNLTNANHNEKVFLIINDADNLNLNSFNALLKTIEEPPKDTIIILILENLQRIPKTIKSRCNLLKFNSLTTKNLKQFCDVKNINLTEDYLTENNFLINGSIHQLLSLQDEVCLDFLKKLNMFLENNFFNIQEYELLFDIFIKNYKKLKFVMFNTIFFKLKNLFIKNVNDLSMTKTILNMLNFIETNFKENSVQFKKQEFLIVFVEFFKIKKL